MFEEQLYAGTRGGAGSHWRRRFPAMRTGGNGGGVGSQGQKLPLKWLGEPF